MVTSGGGIDTGEGGLCGRATTYKQNKHIVVTSGGGTDPGEGGLCGCTTTYKQINTLCIHQVEVQIQGRVVCVGVPLPINK